MSPFLKATLMASILKCKSALPNIHLPFLYFIYNCCARGKSIQSTICKINEPHGHKNGQNTADFQQTTYTTYSVYYHFLQNAVYQAYGMHKQTNRCTPVLYK